MRNRSTQTVTRGDGKQSCTSYRYDLRNRPESETTVDHNGATEEFHYRHDFNGNQVFRQWKRRDAGGKSQPGRVQFARGQQGEVVLEKRRYNILGQLVSLYRDGTVTGYSYRPDGLRHSKTMENAVTTHLWDGGDMVAEYAASGNLTGRYLRGMGLIARDQDNLLQYYLHNAHGDVVQRTDQQGTTLKNYDYDAFGVEENPEALDANPFRYCGEYYDKNSGEYYLRNRMYSPASGRFTSEDPVKSGLNWYTYCEGNPVKYIDPLGLKVYVEGTIKERWSIVNELRKLTDDELGLFKSGEVYIVNENTGEKEEGTTLLRGTIKPIDTQITIQHNKFTEEELEKLGWSKTLKGVNFAVPDSYKNSRINPDGNPGSGSSSNIYFAPNENAFKDFPQIVLGHELIHAYHYMTGTSVAFDTEETKNIGWANYTVTSHQYKAPYEELYTVGIMENLNYPSITTENALRTEQGVRLRSVYRNDWK